MPPAAHAWCHTGRPCPFCLRTWVAFQGPILPGCLFLLGLTCGSRQWPVPGVCGRCPHSQMPVVAEGGRPGGAHAPGLMGPGAPDLLGSECVCFSCSPTPVSSTAKQWWVLLGCPRMGFGAAQLRSWGCSLCSQVFSRLIRGSPGTAGYWRLSPVPGTIQRAAQQRAKPRRTRGRGCVPGHSTTSSFKFQDVSVHAKAQGQCTEPRVLPPAGCRQVTAAMSLGHVAAPVFLRHLASLSRFCVHHQHTWPCLWG